MVWKRLERSLRNLETALMGTSFETMLQRHSGISLFMRSWNVKPAGRSKSWMAGSVSNPSLRMNWLSSKIT